MLEPLVFGLHCCGGLTEAALELACRHSAAFAVVSCCFRSLPALASLSRTADVLSCQVGCRTAGTDATDAAVFCADRLAGTAELGEGKIVGLAGSKEREAEGGGEQRSSEALPARPYPSAYPSAYLSAYPSAHAHESDLRRACTLAQLHGFCGQARAQQAVNAARLTACELRFNERFKERFNELGAAEAKARGQMRGAADAAPNESATRAAAGVWLQAWLQLLPKEFSTQNCVLVGLPKSGLPRAPPDFS
jgi:hypothetical protein